MKLSVSYLSVKKRDVPDVISMLDATNVDYIHVDVMDGKFVTNKTMPFKEMRHISDYTDKRLDIHLMVKQLRH